MRNFNEIFRKDVTYDNIKSHKKPGLHPLSEKCIFGKTTGWGGQIDPPLLHSLYRVNKIDPVTDVSLAFSKTLSNKSDRNKKLLIETPYISTWLVVNILNTAAPELLIFTNHAARQKKTISN